MTSHNHSATAKVTTWHRQTAEAVLEAFSCDPELGLTDEQIRCRQASFGPNALPPPRPPSRWRRFLSQCQNVLIYVLLAAALVTALLGHGLDCAVILGVVLINALIGYLQEGKAEQALTAIRALLSPLAQVRRGGEHRELPSEQLVPGDLVFLNAGDRVPADLRLLRLRGLTIDESALTGESLQVEKQLAPVASSAVLGERTNLAFSGTLVTRGQGMGVVVAIGRATEIGRISTLLGQVQPMNTPLLRQLDRFGHWLAWVILALSLFTLLFGALVRHYSLAEMFLAAVGLAVAAIPEGLPAVITITLAIGVQRMARRNAIIRRLPAVEALGSVTVICSDKTGTLTRNEMTVRRILTAEHQLELRGSGYGPQGVFLLAGQELAPENHPWLQALSRVALLCNDARVGLQDGHWTLVGDPSEGALISLAMRAGLDPDAERQAAPRWDEIPFEAEHRFMATLNHDHQGQRWLLLKGAPERVLALCARQQLAEGEVPLDAAAWQNAMAEAAAGGLRLLALARRQAPGLTALSFADVEAGGFTLLAVLGLWDPPREEAIAAVARCRAAGMQVKMITGDHQLTAQAIGEQLGLAASVRVLGGDELEQLDDEQLTEVVDDYVIFARASPEHKLRLVAALQRRGEVVAMTGDGVNDAPALKRADVGIAMGHKGTEAAKEAAEMVLTDDNFASIAAAVEEGRTVYDNIGKAIVFILPTNFGEAGVVLVAVLLGITLPITPVQILWVNMITAVTLALAEAFEQAEADIMGRPPRPPQAPLLSPFLIWRVLLVSVLLVAGTLGLFLWQQAEGLPLAQSQTLAVNTLVMGEIVYLFNVRHLRSSVLNREGLLGNPYVLLTICILIFFQLLFTYLPPMQRLFGTQSLGAVEWGWIGLFGLALLLLMELEKVILNLVFRLRRHQGEKSANSH